MNIFKDNPGEIIDSLRMKDILGDLRDTRELALWSEEFFIGLVDRGIRST